MDSNRISMVFFCWAGRRPRRDAGKCPIVVVALHVGSIIVGLSVGNIVSLPPLVIQHEFAPRSFGLLVGLNATVGTLIMAVGPGLFGLAHDLSGAMPLLFACASACNWRAP